MGQSWEERHKVVPAVFLLFRDGPKILLLRRAGTGYMDGFYSLPAGHLDGGESADIAACREAKEEVGVMIKPEDLQLVHTVHEKSDGHERLNLGFLVLRYKGQIKNMEPEKCDELRWVDLLELPSNMVPSVRDWLGKVEKKISYSNFNF